MDEYEKLVLSVIIIIVIMIIISCFVSFSESKSDAREYINLNSYIYTDKDSCVEYYVSDGVDNKGNYTPRYNDDGTLKLNAECAKNKEIEKMYENAKKEKN